MPTINCGPGRWAPPASWGGGSRDLLLVRQAGDHSGAGLPATGRSSEGSPASDSASRSWAGPSRRLCRRRLAPRGAPARQPTADRASCHPLWRAHQRGAANRASLPCGDPAPAPCLGKGGSFCAERGLQQVQCATLSNSTTTSKTCVCLTQLHCTCSVARHPSSRASPRGLLATYRAA